MLPKVNRITENREFLKIFKTVRPYHTEHLTFRVAKRITNHQEPITKQIPNVKSQMLNKKDFSSLPAGRAAAPHNDQKLPPRTYNLFPRFGFVVSNKIDKRSARRNGLKRRIRAVIELNLMKIKQPVDVVIQVKKPFNYPYDFSRIEIEVLEGLNKASLL